MLPGLYHLERVIAEIKSNDFHVIVVIIHSTAKRQGRIFIWMFGIGTQRSTLSKHYVSGVIIC